MRDRLGHVSAAYALLSKLNHVVATCRAGGDEEHVAMRDCEVLFEDPVVYRTGDSNPFFKVATAFFSRYLKAVLVGD